MTKLYEMEISPFPPYEQFKSMLKQELANIGAYKSMVENLGKKIFASPKKFPILTGFYWWMGWLEQCNIKMPEVERKMRKQEEWVGSFNGITYTLEKIILGKRVELYAKGGSNYVVQPKHFWLFAFACTRVMPVNFVLGTDAIPDEDGLIRYKIPRSGGSTSEQSVRQAKTTKKSIVDRVEIASKQLRRSIEDPVVKQWLAVQGERVLMNFFHDAIRTLPTDTGPDAQVEAIDLISYVTESHCNGQPEDVLMEEFNSDLRNIENSLMPLWN